MDNVNIQIWFENEKKVIKTEFYKEFFFKGSPFEFIITEPGLAMMDSFLALHASYLHCSSKSINFV